MTTLARLEEALATIARLEKELAGKKDLVNGANLIVLDKEEKMLVTKEATVRSASGKLRWILPGGGVERGETPPHAAQVETEEETGIITDADDSTLIGCFTQRPKGVVFLYETRRFRGDIIVDPKEVSEALFMSFDEVIERREDFGTAYLRMILRWKRCRLGIDKMPYEGRLSDRVEFPRNYNAGKFSDLVLSV